MGTTGSASDGAGVTGATSYCTSLEIAEFLQVNDGADFSTSTKPKKTTVEAAINRVEDIIDGIIQHSWRAISITNEYHDYLIPSFAHRRPFGWVRGRQPDRGIYLKHRAIRSFVSGTNKIEIWTGSTWVDLALDANGYIEGRSDDFWIDYEGGVIYFIDETPAIGKKTCRITYDYGETSVDGDIKEICILLTAITLLSSEDRSVFVVEGMDNLGLDSKATSWKEQADKLLERRKEGIFA